MLKHFPNYSKKVATSIISSFTSTPFLPTNTNVFFSHVSFQLLFLAYPPNSVTTYWSFPTNFCNNLLSKKPISFISDNYLDSSPMLPSLNLSNHFVHVYIEQPWRDITSLPQTSLTLEGLITIPATMANALLCS